MKTFNQVLVILLLLLIANPINNLCAQQEKKENSVTITGDTLFTKVQKIKAEEKVQITEQFFINLAINFVAVFFIIVFIYYPTYRRSDYVFTFLMFNLVVFMLTYVLNEIKISVGAAFGTFAIFSMLRYRTETISTKDMTYLFVFIAIGLISATRLNFYEQGIIVALIFLLTLVLERSFFIKQEKSQTIDYEKIELIKPDREKEMLDDLIDRTGLKIHRISIQKISFLKDTALIKVYYFD